MSKVTDLTGQRFGRLTVIERAGSNKQGRAMWLCRCDCGNTKIVIGHNLQSGSTRSCGCISKENPHHTLHGQTNTRLFRIWYSMKRRCLSPNSDRYPYYGGRGITICDEWLSFENFYKDAMALGYADDLTIDRIDVNDGYHFTNVRFVSMQIQQNNKRNNRFITYKGETKTIAEWERKMGFSKDRLWSRLSAGWSVEEALTIPVGGKRKKK